MKFLFAKGPKLQSLSYEPLSTSFHNFSKYKTEAWALIVNKSQHFHVCSSAVAVNLQTYLSTQAHTHTEAVVKLMGWVKGPAWVVPSNKCNFSDS
jgi:hypothetical protein